MNSTPIFHSNFKLLVCIYLHFRLLKHIKVLFQYGGLTFTSFICAVVVTYISKLEHLLQLLLVIMVIYVICFAINGFWYVCCASSFFSIYLLYKSYKISKVFTQIDAYCKFGFTIDIFSFIMTFYKECTTMETRSSSLSWCFFIVLLTVISFLSEQFHLSCPKVSNSSLKCWHLSHFASFGLSCPVP